MTLIAEEPNGAPIRMHISEPTFDNLNVSRRRVLSLDLCAPGAGGWERFEAATGLNIRVEGDIAVLDEPMDIIDLGEARSEAKAIRDAVELARYSGTNLHVLTVVPGYGMSLVGAFPQRA